MAVAHTSVKKTAGYDLDANAVAAYHEVTIDHLSRPYLGEAGNSVA